jgi:hypothetical protein
LKLNLKHKSKKTKVKYIELKKPTVYIIQIRTQKAKKQKLKLNFKKYSTHNTYTQKQENKSFVHIIQIQTQNTKSKKQKLKLNLKKTLQFIYVAYIQDLPIFRLFCLNIQVRS